MVNYLNATLGDADSLGSNDESFWGDVSQYPSYSLLV